MDKTYSELLRDPRWQKKRLEIMQRDNFTCQHCGRTDKSLQVHHSYYEKGKNPWEYDNDSLITLCDRCHQNETEYKKDLYNQFKSLQCNWEKANLSSATLSSLLSKIDWYVSKAYGEKKEFEENYKYEPAKDFIKECFYGVFNYYDCISARDLHIDLSDIVEDLYPDLLNDYKKKVEKYGK